VALGGCSSTPVDIGPLRDGPVTEPPPAALCVGEYFRHLGTVAAGCGSRRSKPCPKRGQRGRDKTAGVERRWHGRALADGRLTDTLAGPRPLPWEQQRSSAASQHRAKRQARDGRRGPATRRKSCCCRCCYCCCCCAPARARPSAALSPARPREKGRARGKWAMRPCLSLTCQPFASLDNLHAFSYLWPGRRMAALLLFLLLLQRQRLAHSPPNENASRHLSDNYLRQSGTPHSLRRHRRGLPRLPPP